MEAPTLPAEAIEGLKDKIMEAQNLAVWHNRKKWLDFIRTIL